MYDLQSRQSRPSVQVQLVGGPALLREAQVIALSPFQAYLLAAVYGNGASGMTRSELSWLLWESDDTPASRHRVSQLLYGIAKRAGRGCFEETTPGTLKGSLPSDLAELQQSLDLRRAEGALAAAENDLLFGLKPPTAAYAHWLDRRRAALRGQIREAAAAMMAEASAAADWERVASGARVLLALDPSNESLLRRLLEASALRHSREEIDALVQSYRERYAALTGERWSPERETLELLGRIERLAHEVAGEEAQGSPGHPSLVGRSKEMAALHRALTTAPTGVQLTVVAGEAGIGKTRLVQETLDRLRVAGFTVLKSSSSLLQRDLPLHSLLGALSDPDVLAELEGLDEPWRSSLGLLLPGLSPSPPITPPLLDAQGTSRRLMEALYQLLRRVCQSGTVVLFLDDLQWLDKTTLCALEFICERTPALPLRVVFALRDEPGLDPSVRSLADRIQASGTWIEVDELDPASAHELLEKASPRPLHRPEKERLCAAAGRNPFFLIELAVDYCARSSEGGGRDPVANVPSSVKQLIGKRLEGLTREARTLLQLLSVIREIKLEAPVSLEELSPSVLPDVADDLLKARLIHYGAGVITARHDLIRQTAYELMGPVKRAVLHRRAAEAALERMGDAGHGEAAIHYDRAGEKAKAYQHASQAANTAQANGAVPEAIRFWEMARRNATGPVDTTEATCKLAELLYRARRLESAIPMLEAAVALLSDGSASRFLLMRCDALSEMPGASQEKYLCDVESLSSDALTGSDWSCYADGLEVQLRILERLHRPNAIRSKLEEAAPVYLACRADSPYAACMISGLLSLSTLYNCDDEGLQAALEAVRLAKEHCLDALLLKALTRELLCRYLMGDLHSEEGQQVIREAVALAEQSGDLKSRTTIYSNVGCHYLDVGNTKIAEEYFRAAESITSGPSERVMVYCNLAELNYVRRDFEEAERYYRTALEAASRQPVAGFLNSFIAAGLGLCALATGRLSIALQYETETLVALESWIHDPYLLLLLATELQRIRGKTRQAIELVRTRGPDPRRVLYWMRCKRLEARLLRPLDAAAVANIEQELTELAVNRGLPKMITT